MTKAFVPPGYVKITDLDRTDLRDRLAAGELIATVWSPTTGHRTELREDVWLANWSQSMIDSGVLIDAQDPRRERQVVLVKVNNLATGRFRAETSHAASPASAATSSRKRGPKIGVRERVKSEMRQIGIKTVNGWSEVAMEEQFKASRDTCRRALRELRKEIVGK
jgi:hypothetical protein